MKSYILSILLSVLCLSVLANTDIKSLDTEPEKIVSITQKLYDIDYYHTQVTLWKNKVEEKKKEDANALMNYYLACRIVNILTKDQNAHDLQKIYDDVVEKVAESYEYHYLTYLHRLGDTSLFSHLEKAFALDPTRTEVLSHMVAYYAINGDPKQMAFYNELWLKSGEISTGILNWNYNALIGLDKDAILLTNGDNDTYPVWMLQQVEGIRPDVKVINIHLLKNKEYRKHTFEDSEIDSYPNSTDKELDAVHIINHIIQHTNRSIYMNVTLSKHIRETFKDALYTVGLSFRYSEIPYDNMAILKNNYENKFLKDYLKVPFSYDKSASVLNGLNVNYLPAFITLYNHYLKSEEVGKAAGLKTIIENIGNAGGRGDEINAILKKEKDVNRKIDSHIDIKKLDKTIMNITPQLKASNIETSNEFYDKFLLDLLEQKEFELLEKCKSNKVDWMSLLPPNLSHLTREEAYFRTDPDADNVPVTNISYEAAEAYCNWLTLVYNSYPKKKRYKKVLFRLPTEQEWEYAAKAGREAPYPWGGWYAANAKGCFLGNFDASKEEPCDDCDIKTKDNDGAYFLTDVEAYYPNDNGLYGLSGNVAEMVEGGKIAKGGSWQDSPNDCQITSQKEIIGPSPDIGFRVFMEVIENYK